MKKSNPLALLPIGVFLVIYLGLGLLFEYGLHIYMGFYNIPIVVAFLIALLVACLQNRELSFDAKLELMGHGINYVTGDYSRGASGFWVENGEIAFPVQEITIAGNLKTMFKGIEAIGADVYTTGAKSTGSILINRMKVAGT